MNCDLWIMSRRAMITVDVVKIFDCIFGINLYWSCRQGLGVHNCSKAWLGSQGYLFENVFISGLYKYILLFEYKWIHWCLFQNWKFEKRIGKYYKRSLHEWLKNCTKVWGQVIKRIKFQYVIDDFSTKNVWGSSLNLFVN